MKTLSYVLVSCAFVFVIACDKTNSSSLAFGANPTTEDSVTAKLQYDFSDQSMYNRIDKYFSSRARNKGFNGVVLYGKSDKIVFHKAYGYRNFKNKDSLRLNDAFQLASVSKPITALATLQLIQNDKLGLSDTITQYIEDFPYPNITIKQLLSHRSGLPNYMYFSDEYWEDKYGSITNDDVIDIMIQHQPKLYNSPDQRYQYCNTNYALLASIIEIVSGSSFEEYVQENIFDKADMKDAFIYNKRKTPELPDEVIGYNAIYRKKENHYQNGVVGDKGVYASTTDLFKLDRMLHTDTILLQDMLQYAYQPCNPRLTKRYKDNYGLGWRIQVIPDFGQVVYHGGWWKGFKTYYIRMVDKEQCIVVLTNVTKGGFINKKELQSLFYEDI